MDLQKMVDERIEKLRTQKIIISTPVTNEVTSDEPELCDLSNKSFKYDNCYDDKIPVRRNLPNGEALPDPQLRLSELADLMDIALTEVAERILAISDRIAGDYARMEKDILNSRLAVLQGAEAVLDIAISMRRKARNIIFSAVAERDQGLPCTIARRNPATGDNREAVLMQDGRASMHDHGVASLFRKT
jgi:hypothetical protein